MDKKMKIIKDVNIFMGFFLSLFLSITGNVSSGHFSVPFLIMTFCISFIISIIIGMHVPIKLLTDRMIEKKGMKPGSLLAHLLESLISDLIYTPVITLVIITISYELAVSSIPEMAAEQPPNYFVMAGMALLSSFLIGYVLIFIFQPVCIKLAFMKNGIKKPGEYGRPEDSGTPEGVMEHESPENSEGKSGDTGC